MSPDLLASQAAARPDAPALLAGSRRWTWAELDRQVGHAAVLLGESGFGPGDRMAFTLADVTQSVLVLLGCLRAGVVAVPVSTRLPEAAAREAALGIGAPLVTADSGPFDPARLFDKPGRSPARPFPASNGPVTAVFTSGSSGEPRAIAHRLSAHLASAAGAVDALALGSDGRWVLSLPVYHVGGLAPVFRALVSGAALVVPDSAQDALDPRLDATHVSLVATQLIRALDRPRPASVRCVLLGGGPLPGELLERAARLGWPVRASYGLTETASLVTATRPGDDLSSAGRPLAGRRIRVASGGRIQVGGAVLADGTLLADRVAPLPLESGWYETGDLGYIRANGSLVVEGRADARFVSGGENVQPEAIEQVLTAVHGVARALVVPIPDPEFGARPMAYVDGDIDPSRLEAAVRARLPGFMVPVRFETWPDDAGRGGMKASRRHLEDRAARDFGG